MKYIKLFEEWSPNLGYNESEKEELKKNYEKYVMDKDYIPKMIKDLIKKHLSERWHPHPTLDMVEVTWEPEPFEELAKQKGIIKKKEFNDATYAGKLTLKSDFANTPIRYSGAGNPIAGGDYIDLKISPVLFLKFGVPAVTADQFFDPSTLVQNFADLLGVDPSKIRNVQIVRATRSKRQTDSNNYISFEISNDPVTSLSNTVQSSQNDANLMKLTASVTNQVTIF